MWLLINVEKMKDIGKNEKRRICIRNKMLRFNDKALGIVQFEGRGSEFHPATSESED